MHLEDAFIQSDLQLHSGYTFCIVSAFALLTQCSNHWATGTLIHMPKYASDLTGTTKHDPDTFCERDNVIKSAFIKGLLHPKITHFVIINYLVIIFIFFAYKKYYHHFIKFRLNHWWQMDYPGDAFHTFLNLDAVIFLAVNGTATSLPVLI